MTISAANAVLQRLGSLEVPTEIHSDLGAQYINQWIAEMEMLMGFTCTSNTSPPSGVRKEENGIVERANKEVMRWAYIFYEHIYSIRILYRIGRSIYRSSSVLPASTHEPLGCSPADRIFGKSINPNGSRILPRDERPTHQSASEYMARKLKIHDTITKRAAQIQRDRDNQHMATQRAKLMEFKVGTLLQYPVSQHKKALLLSWWQIKILRQLKQRKYIIENLTTGKVEST